jgi:uncharacterized membrane protein
MTVSPPDQPVFKRFHHRARRTSLALPIKPLQQQQGKYSEPASMQSQPAPRIQTIDLARGAALLAMATYHFAWDLEFFGYVDPGMTAQGGWKLFARCIASSFLFLVGVSLVLAMAGIRWPGFLRRLVVAGASLAISMLPISPCRGFIFSASSTRLRSPACGLVFLRLPAAATLAAAAAVIAGACFSRRSSTTQPGWVGLSTAIPH